MDLNMTFCEQYYALYVRCADNQERILAVLLFFKFSYVRDANNVVY